MKRARTNFEAMERTVTALRELGRLETADDARIAAALGLAEAVDADPSNASLWREYRAAEAALREFEDDSASDIKDLRAALSASVRNIEDAGSKHPRPRGGGNGGGARPSADALAAPRRRGGPRAPA